MQIELIVREGQQPGRTFQVERGDHKTIGRAPDCDIRLPDQGVSRRHCTIENLGREIQVIDLDSANGTYVNGKLVEVAPLRPGDQLAVGPTVLECREIKPQSNLDSTTGEARLAIREESANTVVRKVVDTLYPGVETGEAGRPETLAELKRAQKNLATAYQVSKMLASARDLQGLFDGVIGSIFKTLNADRAALLLKQNEDGETGELQIVAARTRKEGQDPGEIAVSRTVVQDVLENAASSLSRDASTQPHRPPPTMT